MMEERTQEEIEWYLERFLGYIKESRETKHPGVYTGGYTCTVRAKKGRVYWAIWIDEEDDLWGPPETSSRIFGFVRRKDGAIFRAATLKAPETRTKNPIRGYIWEDDAKNTFTWTGVSYDMGS